jgi:predicted RNA-binding Zn-ribbon protein involved in translation (DUF1610 family)
MNFSVGDARAATFPYVHELNGSGKGPISREQFRRVNHRCPDCGKRIQKCIFCDHKSPFYATGKALGGRRFFPASHPSASLIPAIDAAMSPSAARSELSGA